MANETTGRVGRSGSPAAAAEDYVKVIYSHTEWQAEPISSSVLAARLGLAASSVTEMVGKLRAAGLVDRVPYGPITLTAEGRRLALRMLRRHRLIETWLAQDFGYDWDQVHEEAEVLEHAVSDRLLEGIDERLGRPVRDPHGDPIPASDGTVYQPSAVVLEDAAEGDARRIVRVSDRDPGLLRYLAAHGIVLDALVVVGAADGASGLSRSLLLGGDPVDLPEDAAAAVWVSADRVSAERISAERIRPDRVSPDR